MSSALATRQQGMTVEAVVDFLRESIRHGRMLPGQRLIAADLTKQLGVSLNAIREALSTLAGAGLIEIQPHRGAVVRTLRRDDIREIFQIREPLEGQAAFLAAQNAGDAAALSTLKSAYVACRAAVRAADPKAYRVANHEFHLAILAMSKNQRLASLAEELMVPIFSLQLHLLLGAPQRIKSDDEHTGLLQAITTGNARLAERLMRAHVRSSALAMEAVVESSESNED